eukprot:Pgem_evm1s16379
MNCPVCAATPRHSANGYANLASHFRSRHKNPSKRSSVKHSQTSRSDSSSMGAGVGSGASSSGAGASSSGLGMAVGGDSTSSGQNQS